MGAVAILCNHQRAVPKTHDKAMENLEKLEIQKTDKHENKTIALGTSKLNYLDPRISVQWCKTHEVPIEKVYTKTHREKFRWAIDMIMNDTKFSTFRSVSLPSEFWTIFSKNPMLVLSSR